MYTSTHMYLYFKIFAWGKVLLYSTGYLGPALLLSLMSTHTATPGSKINLISIIWKSMALLSRLWSRGARPTVNIQNWRRNSNYESTVLGHSDKAHHGKVKQKQPPCCSITLKPWLFAKEVERKKPSVTEADVLGDVDAEAETSGSFFIVLRTGPREAGFDLASMGTARLGRKRRELMPANAYSAP